MFGNENLLLSGAAAASELHVYKVIYTVGPMFLPCLLGMLTTTLLCLVISCSHHFTIGSPIDLCCCFVAMCLSAVQQVVYVHVLWSGMHAAQQYFMVAGRASMLF